MNTIGNNIRTARKALKMSQDALAEAIGANRVTISKYENGSYLPSVPALERLAAALNTTPSQLSGNIEEEPKEKAPRTLEARIVSGGMDKLPKDDRETILNLLRVMYAKQPDIFAEENHDA